MYPKDKQKKISLVSLLPKKQYKLSSVLPEPGYRGNLSGGNTVHPRIYTQIIALLPVYLLQISYGMNSGFPAILTPQLREDCSEFSITADQESWIVSLDNLLTPVICLLSGPLQQAFGPRTMLMVACLPYTVSWLLVSFANNHHTIYISRVMVGFSHALLSTTVYTIEVSSIEMRGTCSVLESVLRCVGCVLVYTLGLFYRWQSIANVSIVIPVFAFLCSFLSPESPYYLVSKQKYVQAEDSLTRLYGPEYESWREVGLLRESLTKVQSKRTRKLEYIQNIRNHPEIYKPFLIVLVLSVVQQFSGMSVIRAYVVKIFDQIFSMEDMNTKIEHDYNFYNYTSNSNNSCKGEIHKTSQLAYISAIIIGVFRLVASLALANLLLRFKRRIMYLISLFLSIACLLTFSLFSYLSSGSVTLTYRWCSLVAACFLVFSVQLGVQTLPLLLSGELFPSDIRATCKGLTRCWTCLLLVVSLKLFPWIETGLTLYGTFLVFSGVLIIFIPITFFILPETKDLSLERIQHYFRTNSVLDTQSQADSNSSTPTPTHNNEVIY